MKVLCVESEDDLYGIIVKVREGKLQYKQNHIHIHGNPYLRLLRKEVEILVKEKYGENHLKDKNRKNEIAGISREIRSLKIKITRLENKKATLLNDERCFLTRFSLDKDPLESYKRIIQGAIHPYLEDNEVLDIETANEAIKSYSKAVDNPQGKAELMIFYVECGNNFTLSYGDIDENFYDSVLDMYELAIETVQELPIDNQKDFRERLYEIMESGSGIGWVGIF